MQKQLMEPAFVKKTNGTTLTQEMEMFVGSQPLISK